MIARFIITEEQARTGTHTGTCGVCGQHTERGHAHTDILQKTTSNITVTFPHMTDTMCEYCVAMWDNGKANPYNRGLLAYRGKVYFPLIAANPELNTPERPTWANAIRDIDPALPRVCVINTDPKKRVWPRARITSGDAISILIHDNSRTISDNVNCSLSKLKETINLLEDVYTLGFSKASMEGSLFSILKQVKLVGFDKTQQLENKLKILRLTPEFLPAVIVCQKREEL